MMKIYRNVLLGSAVAIAVALISSNCLAATIQIQFTGVDLVYDGSSIFDAGASNTTSDSDPADADPLLSVDFLVDGSSVGSLTSDVSLDVYIPDVTGIPATPGIHPITTPGTTPGFFDLLIGTSPLASQGISLNLGEVDVVYNDVANLVQFAFGAAVAGIDGQALPFGLIAGEPVTVTFAAQVVSGTETISSGIVTGFEATGTGTIQAPAVPEPMAVMLALLGAVSVGALYRRR